MRGLVSARWRQFVSKPSSPTLNICARQFHCDRPATEDAGVPIDDGWRQLLDFKQPEPTPRHLRGLIPAKDEDRKGPWAADISSVMIRSERTWPKERAAPARDERGVKRRLETAWYSSTGVWHQLDVRARELT